MSEVFNHKCIKCQTDYSDSDFDAYYCESCNEERKVIAKQVDAKLATTISKRPIKSDLQVYDEICKANGMRFAPIKAMGITL